jgi:hypothetical protein
MNYLDSIKSIEFWAGFGEDEVLNDSTLKALFTARLNRRLDKYFGMLGAGSRLSKIDDTNYSEHPFSTFDIVSGQHDYEFLTDEDDNSISDITAVLIKLSDTGNYVKIPKVTLDNEDAELIMSPNTKPGVPNRYLERNNTIFLDPVPNYDRTDGGKLFYKRVPSYFATSDTTKEAGIPFNFKEMPCIGAAYDWCLVNKSNNQTLITRLEYELNRLEKEFAVYNELRSPQRGKIQVIQQNNR